MMPITNELAYWTTSTPSGATLATVSTTTGTVALRFKVARTREDRFRARTLIHENYRLKGYCLPAIRNDPLEASGAFTLLAETPDGRVLGTITLLFDSPNELPSDEIFSSTLNVLRARGRRLVEVTRFAIATDNPWARQIRVGLINIIFIQAKSVRHHDDFIIEVNPRHVGFYFKLLKFNPLAGPRPCPRVGGAPAVLLLGNLDTYALHQKAQLNNLARSNQKCRRKTLYDFFLPPDREQRIRDYLAQSEASWSTATKQKEAGKEQRAFLMSTHGRTFSNIQ